METIAFCEIDPTAREVLNKHWPDVPKFTDVAELNSSMLPSRPDLICGGFPCQDISIAGLGAGLNGTRSGLWAEYKRIIKECNPKYVVIENVAALRSRGLTAVLQDLWEIGYDTEWHIIPASCLGLPHQRERLWIIAYPVKSGPQEPILQGCRTFSVEPEKPRFSDGWISEWFATWIRRRIIQRGHGVSRSVARTAINQYGNAVVPQIPYIIGKGIMSHEES